MLSYFFGNMNVFMEQIQIPSMPKTKKTLKRAQWVIMAVIIAGLAVVVGCELAVYNASKGRVYSDLGEIPHREVGLLLGTNPKGRRGGANMF